VKRHLTSDEVVDVYENGAVRTNSGNWKLVEDGEIRDLSPNNSLHPDKLKTKGNFISMSGGVLDRIGRDKISDIVGETNFRPGQGGIDIDDLNKYAQDMIDKKFKWNKMEDFIEVIEYADGIKLITGGHHRFVAAQLTGTKIPKKAINITKVDKPSPANLRSWEDVIWFSMK